MRDESVAFQRLLASRGLPRKHTTSWT